MSVLVFRRRNSAITSKEVKKTCEVRTMTLLEVESNGQDTDGRDDDINDSNGWEDIMMPDTFPVMSTRMDAEFAGSPKISRHCIKGGC